MNAKEFIKDVNSAFSAGVFGALLNSFILFLSNRWVGHTNFAAKISEVLSPSSALTSFYPRLIWGGIWGLLFVLPFLKTRSLFERTILVSLVPTFFELLYIFPFQTSSGFFGFHLGTFTPLFVLVSYLLWAFAAAFWFKICR